MAKKREECEVQVRDEVIEQVDAMKYLDVMISSGGSVEKEWETRIRYATRVRGMNEKVPRRKELSVSTKLKVANATMMLMLMHVCKMSTWSLSKQQQS